MIALIAYVIYDPAHSVRNHIDDVATIKMVPVALAR